MYTLFDGYTWYIQSILNRLYERYRKVEDVELLRNTILSVVESKAPQYESLTLFLTRNQFALLKSVAKEGVVKEPMAAEFLKKHRLPGASSVRTALEALVEGELLYRQTDGYIVYDRFLALWLKRL